MQCACFNCNQALEYTSATSVARKDECSACGQDVHCCKNCKFFDESAYNNCREPQAERVVDSEKANFCDYFALKTAGAGGDDYEETKKKTLSALDDLFK